MNHVEMSKIIRERAREMRDADRNSITVGYLADTAELLMVLARILDGRDASRAFGSPGDWGYNTPIGRALAAASPVPGVDIGSASRRPQTTEPA